MRKQCLHAFILHYDILFTKNKELGQNGIQTKSSFRPHTFILNTFLLFNFLIVQERNLNLEVQI